MQKAVHSFTRNGQEVKLTQKQLHRFYSSIAAPNEVGCMIWVGGKRRDYGVFSIRGEAIGAHRASWLIHNGEIPDDHYVCHKCDNPLCCNIDHLFLGTHQDNESDKHEKGRHAHGETHGMVRLTAEQVLKIRRLYAEGKGTIELGELFGITQANAHSIVARKTWAHIPDDGSSALNPNGRKTIKRVRKGEGHHKSPLTEQDVLDIRQGYASGLANGVQLASLHGISPSSIMRIINRESWKHI